MKSSVRPDPAVSVPQAQASGSAVTAPLIVLLDELHGVLTHVTDQQYAASPVGVIPSSIGGHVRHCLDHIATLVASSDADQLCYDHRERGTDVEKRRAAALDEITRLRARLQDLSAQPHRELTVSVLMAADAPPLTVKSSYAREAAYVLSHTIHHNAIISAMVRTLGGTPPPCFGFAPSTLEHIDRQPCAR